MRESGDSSTPGAVSGTNGRLPTISVVIPTFERPARLARCLAALADNDYPPERFEVIVVDDGGRVDLAPVVDAGSRTANVRLSRQPHSGPAAARNHGARQAEGHLLAFLDDDCVPRRDWLSAFARFQGDDSTAAVGGHVVNALRDDRRAVASQMLIDYLCAYYDRGPDGAGFVTSSNLLVPHGAFVALGGFNTSFSRAGGEDRDFCDRWRAAGGRLGYARGAIVDHYHAMTLAAFWRQHFNYGRGAYGFHRLRKQRSGEPFRVEPPTFYVELLRRPLLQPRWRCSLLALLILAQLANAIGFFSEAYTVRALRDASPRP